MSSKKEPLDLIPGTKAKKPSDYPGLRVSTWKDGGLEVDYYARHSMPKKIHENDWIPMIAAAWILNISKQALSDRIRRGTLTCRPENPTRYSSEKTVKMVQLMDCRKKKKAGRPKKI